MENDMAKELGHVNGKWIGIWPHGMLEVCLRLEL